MKLKNSKILKDSDQEPAIRVALRGLKDFAIPFKFNGDIMWRYAFVPESEIVNFKEAVLIAYAGYLRILKQPNLIAEVTGASKDSVGGCIYLP